ncbi:hypothetical protein D3C87_259780 [compost metagenome]
MQYPKPMTNQETLKNFTSAELIREVLRRVDLSHHDRFLVLKSVHTHIKRLGHLFAPVDFQPKHYGHRHP